MVLPHENEISFIDKSQKQEIVGSDDAKQMGFSSANRFTNLTADEEPIAENDQTISSIDQSNPQEDALNQHFSND